MKNQFVGDINDYYKYGLLRILSDFGKKEIGVCWMLTTERTQYLDDPGRWRKFDPVLFGELRRIVRTRKVSSIEKAGILAGARLYGPLLKNNSRKSYFDAMLRTFAGVDLIFFDPDTGLAPSASKSEDKWLHYHELREAFGKGHSVFVIQFPWFKKDWVRLLVKRIHKATRAAKIWTFRTASVVFFLASQRRHVSFFRRRAQIVKRLWGSEITVAPDPDRE